MKNIVYYLLIIFFLGSCEQTTTSPNTSSTKNQAGLSNSGSGIGGSTARFTIAQAHLYIATEDRLFTYDLSNPAIPTFQTKHELSGVETIFSQDNYLYLGTQNGVLIFDISNPNQPHQISTYPHITSCDPVIAKGNYAYSTLRTNSNQPCWRGINSLDIIDISNKKNPTQVARVNLTGPIGLGIHQNDLYICDDNQIKHFKVDQPESPNYAGATPLDGCFDIIIQDQLLIAVSSKGIHQFYIESNGTLTKLSTILTK